MQKAGVVCFHGRHLRQSYCTSIWLVASMREQPKTEGEIFAALFSARLNRCIFFKY